MKVAKIVSYTVILIAGGLLIAYLILPTGPRDPMEFEDPQGKRRAVTSGSEYMVVTGTPWATEVAADVLEQGGNACDATVAALLMINVTYGEAASFPSVAPLLHYNAQTKQVRSYSGVGTAPSAATIQFFKDQGHDVVPRRSILAQLIPASPDAMVRLLQDCGSMGFAELADPSIEMARNGFPVHNSMLENFEMGLLTRLGFTVLMPYNAEVYLNGQWWRPLHHGDRFRRPDLARTLEEMARAELEALESGLSRKEALEAVRSYFYEGPIAEKIVTFHEKEDGLITARDLAEYRADWDEPLVARFGEYTIYTNPTYTQGIALLLAIQILEEDREYLKGAGHNSAEYAHRVLQAIELAMADREAFAGDPKFVSVPLKKLLGTDYAKERRIHLQKDAFPGTPPALSVDQINQTTWNPRPQRPTDNTLSHTARQDRNGHKFSASPDTDSQLLDRQVAYNGSINWDYVANLLIRTGISASRGEQSFLLPGKDTSYISIVDKQGNAISLTPSDFPISPMVPDTGLTLGIRMTQFRLQEDHPSSLEPGKRPRITPHAVMVFKNGEFYMSCGTPGGEMQTQATLQFLLNHILFEMDPQEAVQAFRFRSRNWPDAFSPHEYLPHTIELEESLAESLKAPLEAKGYEVNVFPDYRKRFGAVGAALRLKDRLLGAADPREETWAKGR